MDLRDPIQKAEYMARWAQARHAQRLADGLCTKCGDRTPAAGFRVCDPCKQALKDQRRGRIAAGLCSNCGKPRRTKKFIYCRPCRRLKTDEYQGGRVARLAQEKLRKQTLKRDVFAAYGGAKCQCCGVDHIEFLSIDHIDGNGAAHRKLLKLEKRGGGNFYYWLRREGFPAGFRVLCMNCNFALGHFGHCPHERERQKETSGDVSGVPAAG